MSEVQQQTKPVSMWLRLALAVLLLASHGLLLAHSGEHLFETGNPVCEVCTAGQSFTAVAVDTTSAGEACVGLIVFSTAAVNAPEIAAQFPSDPARAPPVIL